MVMDVEWLVLCCIGGSRHRFDPTNELDEVAVFVIFEVDGNVDKYICKTVFTGTDYII